MDIAQFLLPIIVSVIGFFIGRYWGHVDAYSWMGEYEKRFWAAREKGVAGWSEAQRALDDMLLKVRKL